MAVRRLLLMSRWQPRSGTAVSCPSRSRLVRQISEGAEVRFIQSLLLVLCNPSVPKIDGGDGVVRHLSTTVVDLVNTRLLSHGSGEEGAPGKHSVKKSQEIFVSSVGKITLQLVTITSYLIKII